MFGSILAAIAAIPKLIDAIQALLGQMRKWEDQKYFEKLNEAFSKIENGPSTTADKQDAAKGIGDAIQGL